DTQETTGRVRAQYSIEPQLQGKTFDGKLDWTVGAFYLKASSPFGRSHAGWFGSPTFLLQNGSESSKAIYAQSTLDTTGFIDNLNLTLGVRKSWDRVTTMVINPFTTQVGDAST